MNPTKKKILLVDNNEFTRLMFSDIFWLHGLDDECEFSAVATTEEALPIINTKETRPDVVFTGLVMPINKDGKAEVSAEAGFSLIQNIKSNPETKSVRVVVFSDFDEEEYREHAKALGAEMYLRKDSSIPQDLVRIVHSLDTTSAI